MGERLPGWPRMTEGCDSSLLHCSWCGHRVSEEAGHWYHCEETSELVRLTVEECPGADRWPLHPDIETGVTT